VYNPDTDQTTVRSQPEPLNVTAGSAAAHYVTIAYAHPGQDPQNQAAGPVKLYIQTARSGRLYSGQTTARLVVDDQTVVLPLAEYERRSSQSHTGKGRADRSNETLAIVIPDDLLA